VECDARTTISKPSRQLLLSMVHQKVSVLRAGQKEKLFVDKSMLTYSVQEFEMGIWVKISLTYVEGYEEK